MTTNQIKALCDKWEATGRSAVIYPQKKRVSLNGHRPTTYADTAKTIRILLARQD